MARLPLGAVGRKPRRCCDPDFVFQRRLASVVPDLSTWHLLHRLLRQSGLDTNDMVPRNEGLAPLET